MQMGKHDKVLEAIFSDPVSGCIRWKDIESLLEHHGAEITEGRGSRVRVALNGVRATFLRPHPSPETTKGAVRSVRAFLIAAGVTKSKD